MGVQPTTTISCTLHLPIMDLSIEDPYPYLSQAKATSRIPQCLSAGRCHTSGPLSIHENPFQRTIIHCPVLAITAAAITSIESSRIAIGMTVTRTTLICSRPIARMKEQIRWMKVRTKTSELANTGKGLLFVGEGWNRTSEAVVCLGSASERLPDMSRSNFEPCSPLSGCKDAAI